MSQIWLPNTGPRKSYRVGTLRFFGEDGQVIWEDEHTGKSGSMMPDKALRVARQLGRDLLAKSTESSIGKDSQERAEIGDLLRYLEELAKTQLAKQPDRSGLTNLIWTPN